MASDIKYLYDYFFIVEHKDGKNEVIQSHPPSPPLLKVHPNVLKFVRPEATPEAFKSSTRFKFALTVSSGQLEYGFCHRAELSGTVTASLCILSSCPWFDFYAKALIVARQEFMANRGISFMKTLYDQRNIPNPGGSITIPFGNIQHTLQRPMDDFPLLGAGLPHLFNAFGVANTLALFGCLLEERRLLICGDNLDLVSACVFSLAGLLAPFRWQNPFIPVLPHGMTDVLCAPFPFFIGTHVDNLKGLENLPTEQILVADVRNGNFVGAEDRIRLPGTGTFGNVLQKLLAKREKDGKVPADMEVSVRLCFIDFFVSMLGKYRIAMYSVGEDTVAWNEEQFLQYLKTKGGRLHEFVDVMRKTQMFEGWKRAILNEENGVEYEDDYQVKFLERCAERYPDLHDGVRKKKKWSKAMWKSLKKGGTNVLNKGITNSKIIANKANKAGLLKPMAQLQQQIQLRLESGGDSEGSLTCPRRLTVEELELDFTVLHLILAPQSAPAHFDGPALPVSTELHDEPEEPGFFGDLADEREPHSPAKQFTSGRLGDFLQLSMGGKDRLVTAEAASDRPAPVPEEDLFGAAFSVIPPSVIAVTPAAAAAAPPRREEPDLFSEAILTTQGSSNTLTAPWSHEHTSSPVSSTAPSESWEFTSPKSLGGGSHWPGQSVPPAAPQEDLFAAGDLFASPSPPVPAKPAPAPAPTPAAAAASPAPTSPDFFGSPDPFGAGPRRPAAPPSAVPKAAAPTPTTAAPAPTSDDLFGSEDPFSVVPPKPATAAPAPPAPPLDLFGAQDPFGAPTVPSKTAPKPAAAPVPSPGAVAAGPPKPTALPATTTQSLDLFGSGDLFAGAAAVPQPKPKPKPASVPTEDLFAAAPAPAKAAAKPSAPAASVGQGPVTPAAKTPPTAPAQPPGKPPAAAAQPDLFAASKPAAATAAAQPIRPQSPDLFGSAVPFHAGPTRPVAQPSASAFGEDLFAAAPSPPPPRPTQSPDIFGSSFGAPSHTPPAAPAAPSSPDIFGSLPTFGAGPAKPPSQPTPPKPQAAPFAAGPSKPAAKPASPASPVDMFASAPSKPAAPKPAAPATDLFGDSDPFGSAGPSIPKPAAAPKPIAPKAAPSVGGLDLFGASDPFGAGPGGPKPAPPPTNLFGSTDPFGGGFPAAPAPVKLAAPKQAAPATAAPFSADPFSDLFGGPPAASPAPAPAPARPPQPAQPTPPPASAWEMF